MKYLIDCANPEKIKEVMNFYPVEGVTTNPTIVSREKCDFAGMLKEIRHVIGNDSMLHAQTTSENWRDMVNDGIAMNEFVGGNFYVKIPACHDGLRAIRELKKHGIGTTATAVFSASQALICARAGADFVAPYVNKLDDVGDGVLILNRIVTLFREFQISTKVLSASFRNVEQVTQTALAGSDYATLPPAFFEKLIWHPMTDLAVSGFEADWRSVYAKETPNTLLKPKQI